MFPRLLGLTPTSKQIKVKMTAATLTGTNNSPKGHFLSPLSGWTVGQGANTQTWWGSTKHRHVVLNTGTLGAPGHPGGPISSEGHRSHCGSCVTSASLLWIAKASEVCHLGAVLGLGISGVSSLCHSSWRFITLCPCVGQTEDLSFTSWRSWEQDHTQIFTNMLEYESWYAFYSPNRGI